jgi:glycosyltransferase involved in cell wall biosynthesis
MALRTLLRETPPDAARSERPSPVGGAMLWAGTVTYGASTVALLAVLSRHSSKTAFSAVAALLGLSFVISLIPSGIMLRSASLVADGRPPPALTVASSCLIAGVSLVLSPLLALLLHVSVLAAAIVTIQMLVAIPLSIRQGALLGRHRFDAIGTNLAIEGFARFVLGALAGIALGVTGLALGICAGTAVALVVVPRWRSDATLVERPRTSLTATSASLALLGLFVQLDVLIAPSVIERGGATAYDLAAVPSKGVYLALLAIGPLIFPSVRGRPDRHFVLRATAISLAFGVGCTVILVLFRHLIGAVLGRPAADPLEMALLGLAMALAGATGIAISAGIAQGMKHPWPPLALGIVVLLACWPWHPGGLAFSVVVVTSQAGAMVLCLANCMRKISPAPEAAEDVMELFAEAGDPLVPAQAIGRLSESDTAATATAAADHPKISSQRLWIVAVTWRDLAHPSAGGAEVLIDRVLDGLHQRGHRVTLVCGGPVSKHPYEVIDAGGTYSQYLRAPAICLHRFRKADVVIDVQNGMPFFSPLWRRRPSVCLVHHVHTDQWATRFPRPFARVMQAAEHHIMPAVYRNRRYVAISRSTQRALGSLGVPAESVTVIESGVDLHHGYVPPRSDEPLLLSLNRLVPHKRIDLLLRAWEVASPHVPGRLVVAGDGPLLGDLRRQAAPLRRVEVLGRVSEEEKVELLARAWGVLSVAHHEGWGMSMLEGAVFGTPALAVDAPGIRDAVIDGVTGHLVPADNESKLPEVFGQAMVSFVNQHDRRALLGAAALLRAHELGWDRSIDRWEKVLLEASALS